MLQDFRTAGYIQDGSITEFIIIDFRTSMPPKVDCKLAQRPTFK